jgi:hypothetical protein
MESSTPIRVLVVAHKTAATPPLIEAVRERAQRGPCTFTLLVPSQPHGLHKVVDPEDTGDDEAQEVIALATPLLEGAAGAPIATKVGAADPLAAIEEAVSLEGYDEIILSTLPAGVSRWIKMDLPSKVKGIGLPVTHVPATERAA